MFLIALVFLCGAAGRSPPLGYDVSFILTRNYDDKCNLTVLCDGVNELSISALSDMASKMISHELHCVNTKAPGDIVFRVSCLSDEDERSFSPETDGWIGYWGGIIIGISATGGRSSNALDCLGKRFTVGDLAVTSVLHDYAIVDSSGIVGNFGEYYNIDSSGGVFAFEKEVRYVNGGEAVPAELVRCFASTGEVCCNEPTYSPSKFVVELHIFDDFDYEGLILCVGSASKDCSLGVYRARLMRPRGMWRHLYISVPASVISYDAGLNKVKFLSSMFLTVFGYGIGDNTASSRIVFNFGYLDHISFEEVQDFSVGGITRFSSPLRALFFIASEAHEEYNSSYYWSFSLIQLKVGPLPSVRRYTDLEMFYIDGYHPRRVKRTVYSGSTIEITVRSAGRPTNMVRVFCRLGRRGGLMSFDIYKDGGVPVVNHYGSVSGPELSFVDRSDSEVAYD